MTCRSTADTLPLPSAPTGLVLTGIDTGIVLDWNDNVASEQVTSYKVYRSTNQGGPFSLLATVTVSAKTDLTGVSGTLYWFRIAAVNSAGIGPYTEVSGRYTGDVTAPSDVTILTGPTQVGTTAVNLTWSNATEADFAGCKVYAKQDAGAYALVSGSTLVVNGTFTHTSAVANHDWTYKITSVDQAGNESTGTVSTTISIPLVDTTPPATPTNVVATGRSDGIFVDWDSNTETDLAGYNIYYDGDGYGTPLNGDTIPATTSSYLDESAAVGTPRIYKVEAFDNDVNVSAKSSASNSAERLETSMLDLTSFTRAGTMVPCVIHARGINLRRYWHDGSAPHLDETLDFTALASGTQLTADYSWDFAAGTGNPRGTYSQFKGWNGAHAYDQSGTYIVQLTRTDQAGKTDIFQARITLGADTRTVVYCSPTGSSTGNGTSASSPISPARAQALLNGSAAIKIRLQNGATYNSSSAPLFTLSKANQMIEGYSFPSAPSTTKPTIKYTGTANTSSSLISITSGGTNAVVQDINFTRATGRSRCVSFSGSCNALVRRCTAETNARFFSCDESTGSSGGTTRYVLIQECQITSITGFNSYFIFPVGQDFVFFGNKVPNIVGSHGLRASRVSRLLFAFNDFTNMNRQAADPLDDSRTPIEIQHGTDSYIYQNVLTADTTNAEAPPTLSKQDGKIALGPLRGTDGHANEYTKYVCLDGNQINAAIQLTTGLTDLMIRNNLIIRPDSRPIFTESVSGVDTDGIAYTLPNARLYIFNNTIYNTGQTGIGILIADPISDLQIKNNHYVAPNASSSSNLHSCVDLRDGFGTNNVFSRNCWPSVDNMRVTGITETTAKFNLRSQAGTETKEATSVDTIIKPASNSVAATYARPVAGVHDDRLKATRDRKAATWTCGCYQR